MNDIPFLALLHNAALLLATVVLYDVVARRIWTRWRPLRQVVNGLILGAIGMATMLTPWSFAPGIIFDTRSILLGITGLFFGTIPAAVAMVMTAALRFYQGGAGTLTGVFMILASGLIGVAWRRAKRNPLVSMGMGELLLFGLVIHVVMLTVIFIILPWDTALHALARITLPFLTIYPVATALLGALMVSRLTYEKIQTDLQNTNRELDRYFSLSLDLLCIADTHGRFLRLNPEWEKVLGYPVSELEGRPFLGFVHPDDQAATLSAMARLEAQKELTSFENRYRCRDGSYRWIEWRARPMGTTVYAAARDVTLRKQDEETLRQARDTAESATRAKSTFLATMSHEIRTPLNAIMGFTDLTLGTALSDEQRRFLTIVKNRSADLLTILNDILDLSRIEADRLPIHPKPFDAGQLANEVIALFAIEADRKRLALSAHVAPDLPTPLEGDALRIKQVLMNLLGNAIKFTDRGSIDVNVEQAVPTPANGSDNRSLSLRFSVRDTGIGIAADQQSLIFQPFIQADGSTTRRHGGTGLGLAIAQRLVELMGGTIGCQSEPGRGSLFHFTLPLTRSRAGNVLPPHEPLTRNPTSKGHPLRVLVVDDDEASRLLAGQLLSRAGQMVDYAADGAEAIRKLADSDFDLVLMDIRMPGLDGLKATRQIRGSASPVRRRDIPIIALTAHAMAEDEERCLQAGMNAYLAKPIQARHLFSLAEKFAGAADHA